MALFLTENDVKQVLTTTMALEAVESAHRDLALGQAQDTPRARTRLPQTALHILQGALPAQGVLGYKEKPSVPYVECVIPHSADTSLRELADLVDVPISFDTDTRRLLKARIHALADTCRFKPIIHRSGY